MLLLHTEDSVPIKFPFNAAQYKKEELNKTFKTSGIIQEFITKIITIGLSSLNADSIIIYNPIAIQDTAMHLQYFKNLNAYYYCDNQGVVNENVMPLLSYMYRILSTQIELSRLEVGDISTKIKEIINIITEMLNIDKVISVPANSSGYTKSLPIVQDEVTTPGSTTGKIIKNKISPEIVTILNSLMIHVYIKNPQNKDVISFKKYAQDNLIDEYGKKINADKYSDLFSIISYVDQDALKLFAPYRSILKKTQLEQIVYNNIISANQLTPESSGLVLEMLKKIMGFVEKTNKSKRQTSVFSEYINNIQYRGQIKSEFINYVNECNSDTEDLKNDLSDALSAISKNNPIDSKIINIINKIFVTVLRLNNAITTNAIKSTLNSVPGLENLKMGDTFIKIIEIIVKNFIILLSKNNALQQFILDISEDGMVNNNNLLALINNIDYDEMINTFDNINKDIGNQLLNIFKIIFFADFDILEYIVNAIAILDAATNAHNRGRRGGGGNRRPRTNKTDQITIKVNEKNLEKEPLPLKTGMKILTKDEVDAHISKTISLIFSVFSEIALFATFVTQNISGYIYYSYSPVLLDNKFNKLHTYYKNNFSFNIVGGLCDYINNNYNDSLEEREAVAIMIDRHINSIVLQEIKYENIQESLGLVSYLLNTNMANKNKFYLEILKVILDFIEIIEKIKKLLNVSDDKIKLEFFSLLKKQLTIENNVIKSINYNICYYQAACSVYNLSEKMENNIIAILEDIYKLVSSNFYTFKNLKNIIERFLDPKIQSSQNIPKDNEASISKTIANTMRLFDLQEIHDIMTSLIFERGIFKQDNTKVVGSIMQGKKIIFNSDFTDAFRVLQVDEGVLEKKEDKNGSIVYKVKNERLIAPIAPMIIYEFFNHYNNNPDSEIQTQYYDKIILGNNKNSGKDFLNMVIQLLLLNTISSNEGMVKESIIIILQLLQKHKNDKNSIPIVEIDRYYKLLTQILNYKFPNHTISNIKEIHKVIEFFEANNPFNIYINRDLLYNIKVNLESNGAILNNENINMVLFDIMLFGMTKHNFDQGNHIKPFLMLAKECINAINFIKTGKHVSFDSRFFNLLKDDNSEENNKMASFLEENNKIINTREHDEYIAFATKGYSSTSIKPMDLVKVKTSTSNNNNSHTKKSDEPRTSGSWWSFMSAVTLFGYTARYGWNKISINNDNKKPEPEINNNNNNNNNNNTPAKINKKK